MPDRNSRIDVEPEAGRANLLREVGVFDAENAIEPRTLDRLEHLATIQRPAGTKALRLDKTRKPARSRVHPHRAVFPQNRLMWWMTLQAEHLDDVHVVLEQTLKRLRSKDHVRVDEPNPVAFRLQRRLVPRIGYVVADHVKNFRHRMTLRQARETATERRRRVVFARAVDDSAFGVRHVSSQSS